MVNFLRMTKGFDLTNSTTFLDALTQALQTAGAYNAEDQTAPAAVLWPDKERQWEALIPALRSRLPLFTLGDYNPTTRSGSAYWIRCAIAGQIPAAQVPPGAVPVIYLPGVGRADLRAIEDCPKHLQPLIELQFRGTIWYQRNGHDWTLAAFLQSASGGLGLAVAADQATQDALKRALLKLAAETLDRLQKEAPLKAAFFDGLLNPDESRSLLRWLEDPTGYRQELQPEEWHSFCNVCKSRFDFHPEKDGPLSAAQMLGLREKNWAMVWHRFAESPAAYPHLPERLRQARPPFGLFDDHEETWPQDNERAEEELQGHLAALASFSPKDARAALLDLEAQHGVRREWVWARLGRSPLATALKPLAELADHTAQALPGATAAELVAAFLATGWRADHAALSALESIQKPGNPAVLITAVKAAVRAVYAAWLEDAARRYQKAVVQGPLAETYPFSPLSAVEKGTVILFSDALRMDAGQRLADALRVQGCAVELSPRLAALPPITSTAKPALTPVAAALSGKNSHGLGPAQIGKDAPLTADALRKILQEAGYQILTGDSLGDPAGLGWTEMGEIDAYGHEHGCKVAVHLEGELLALRDRIMSLLQHGWKRITVVTDHGWLLLPGGLPKAFIPEHLTEVRKGRCARLKMGAHTELAEVPWHWDPEARVAIAPATGSFEAGKDYEHGGISLQECVTPQLVVTVALAGHAAAVKIEDVHWTGLRLTAKIIGAQPGAVVDVRTKAGDAASSLVIEAKSPGAKGEVALFVEDEDHIGAAANIVVTGADGLVQAQTLTTIGG